MLSGPNMTRPISMVEISLKKIVIQNDLTMGAKDEGKQWYKSKNNCRVLKSKKAGLQLVGIWTVERSSEDSSGEVPMKSKDKQLSANRSKWLTRVCWVSSLKVKFFQLSRALLSRSWEIWNISYKWASLNEDAIFRCLVIERLASFPLIWLTSQVSCDRSWTPMMQYSSEPCITWNKN